MGSADQSQPIKALQKERRCVIKLCLPRRSTSSDALGGFAFCWAKWDGVDIALLAVLPGTAGNS